MTSNTPSQSLPPDRQTDLKKLRKLLKDNGGSKEISQEKLAQVLTLAKSTVRRRLDQFTSLGYIQIKKREKQGNYADTIIWIGDDREDDRDHHPICNPLTGTIQLGSSLYVEREADDLLRQTFSAHADESSLFIRIKGAQGTGKSSLLVRLGQFLENEQRQTVRLVRLENTVESKVLTDLDKLLYHFTHIVAQAFKDALSTELPDLRTYWRHDLAPGLNCTDYLHEHIFAKLDRPKTLLIDGIDTILGQPTQTPFLELIRSWNEEKMKRVSREPIVWPHIVIAYSTEPYASLDLPGGSPLQNVGMPVELPEFTEAQVLHQAQKYGLNWDLYKVKQLMALIGGHPELVNRALYQIGQNQMELDRLLSQADRLNGPFSDYLLKNLKLLQDHPKLSQCFVKILNKEESRDEFAKFQLEKAGLIRIEGSQASARFELYQRYFQTHL